MFFWYIDFHDIINKIFPNYKKYELNKEIAPIIRFKRIEKDKYFLNFIECKYKSNIAKYRFNEFQLTQIDVQEYILEFLCE